MNGAVKYRISAEEYLQGELQAEVKHEVIDGEVYAMAVASKNPQRIAGNIYRELGDALGNSPCEPFFSNINAKVSNNFFYPDVMVVCEEPTDHPYYSESPTILVEVLSSPTRRIEETIKRTAYQSIPTLQEYLLIEQDFVDVEICRRSEGRVRQYYFLGDQFTLDSIGVSVSVEDIWRRVQSEDLLTYLQQQAVEDVG